MPGGETESNVSAWTVDSLKELMLSVLTEMDRRYEQRFEAQQVALRDALLAQEKAVTAALNAAERAVSKAELASERRFESINEFRGQLADQAATLMPRAETAVLLDSINERLATIEKRVDERAGALKGQETLRAVLLTTAGLLIAAIAVTVALVK